MSTQKTHRFGKFAWIVRFTDQIPRYDIQKSRVSAALGYLFFMLPLVFAEDRQFARFHCNQGFLNFILSTVVAVLLRTIPVVGPYLLIVQELLCIIFAVRGIILALRGKAISLPLVGWITVVPYRMPGQ